jgi:hypothetical protein
MARQARCWQVRSALTQKVNVIEANNVNIHAVLVRVASGQLPFSGSSRLLVAIARHTRCCRVFTIHRPLRRVVGAGYRRMATAPSP